MLIGYVRVSKSDGTQTLAPQRDAMLAAGVDPTRIYEDLASGRHDARPGLIACLKAIQPGSREPSRDRHAAIRLTYRASRFTISRPSHTACAQSQIACARPSLQSQLIWPRPNSRVTSRHLESNGLSLLAITT